MPKPAPGLYEALFTAGLTRQVAALPEGQRAVQEALDASRGPHVLARHLHDRLVSALRATPDI